MSPLIRHPKKRGEWVELQFMARAAAHGFTVSKPWGDTARYDFAVEHNGIFRRVQVKSTFQQSPKGRNAYLANTVSRAPQRKPNPAGKEYVSKAHGSSRTASGGKNRAGSAAALNPDGSKSYTCADIDFFAFYIIPEDIWYIVPIGELSRARYAVYLNPHESGNKYFRYMEAWHLLRKDT
ncbi:MAG: group I intron-associated PD-(D/E)XK endonuclease [Terriglobales bacterium]